MTDGAAAGADARRTPHGSSGRRSFAFVVGLYLALTLAFTYPLSVRPSNTVLDDGPDMHLFLWTLAWDTHALTSDPLHVFDANIYHPKRYTLAYSENLLGSAILAAPIVWLTGNHVLALNLVLILSTFLCAVGGYVLARRVGCSVAAAVVAGLIFGFAPSRFTRISQAHLAAIQWVPFTLAYLHGYFASGDRRDLRLAILFATLQVAASGHGAAFLVVGLACLIGYRLALGEPLEAWRRLRDGGVVLLGGIAIVAFIAWPYHRVQVEEGLRRTLENWVVPAESYLASPSHVHQWLLSLAGWQQQVNDRANAYLFPGIVPLALVGVACIAWLGDCGARVRRGVHAMRQRRQDRVPSGPAATGDQPPRPSLGWRAAAIALTSTAVVTTAVALWVATQGPIRTGRGSLIALSIRDAARPALIAVLAVCGRLWLARRVVFTPPWTIVRTRREAAPSAPSWTPLRAFVAAAKGDATADADFAPTIRQSVRAWATDARTSGIAPMAIVTIVGTLIAVGPPLSLWPYVYWLPGFNFVRVPSRFMLVAVLGGAIVAARGVDGIMARCVPSLRTRLVAVLGALIVVESFAAPLVVQPYAIERPSVDTWLASQPRPVAVAEVPLADPEHAGRWERAQTTYMLHSLAHFAPTVHGYSGYRAALHETLYRALVHFPDDDSLRLLREAGVTHVVVHPNRYAEGAWPAVDARLQARTADLRLVHEDVDGRVYQVR